MKREYVIDGNNFNNLEGFFDEISRVLLSGVSWGRNLDAFNDVLRGGFGTPEDGFVVRWINSEKSREKLGYPETVRTLKASLARCHPTSAASVQSHILRAEKRVGPTVFDDLVAIVQIHCAGGEEEGDGVELLLD